jgi:integrase/recombinase XerD
MPPRKGKFKKPERPIGDPTIKGGFATWVPRYLEWLRVRAFSDRTVLNRQAYLRFLVEWLEDRSVVMPGEVTKPVLERYQRHLYYYRQGNGRPLSFRAQHQRLVTVRAFFRWLAKQNVIPANPASELELPRLPHRLPPPVLTHEEIERVMVQPDLETPVGIRDRAIMEVFYSTGVRRTELANLRLVDLDGARGTLMIREGKGGRDRIVPIGERAIHWVQKYLEEVRPQWALSPDNGILFLSMLGDSLHPDGLTTRVRNYVRAADIGKTGACHAFRHAMATAMLDAGADIRSIQEILGHASLESTQLYTHVSIRKLQAIHAATHPAAMLHRHKPAQEPASADTDDAKADLLNALEAEEAAEADVSEDLDPDRHRC